MRVGLVGSANVREQLANVRLQATSTSRVSDVRVKMAEEMTSTQRRRRLRSIGSAGIVAQIVTSNIFMRHIDITRYENSIPLVSSNVNGRRRDSWRWSGKVARAIFKVH